MSSIMALRYPSAPKVLPTRPTSSRRGPTAEPSVPPRSAAFMASSTPHYFEGQAILVLQHHGARANGSEGAALLCSVSEDEGRKFKRMAGSGGDGVVTYDGCSQAVFPWIRNNEKRSMAARLLAYDVRVVAIIGNHVKHLPSDDSMVKLQLRAAESRRLERHAASMQADVDARTAAAGRVPSAQVVPPPTNCTLITR